MSLALFAIISSCSLSESLPISGRSVSPGNQIEGDAGNWDLEFLRSRPDVRPLLAGHIRDH